MELGIEVGELGDIFWTEVFPNHPAASSEFTEFRKFSNSSRTWGTSISCS